MARSKGVPVNWKRPENRKRKEEEKKRKKEREIGVFNLIANFQRIFQRSIEYMYNPRIGARIIRRGREIESSRHLNKPSAIAIHHSA